MNIIINFEEYTIKIDEPDTISVMTFYEQLKEEWYDNDGYRKFRFPLKVYDGQQFEFICPWKPACEQTIKLLSGGHCNHDRIFTIFGGNEDLFEI